MYNKIQPEQIEIHTFSSPTGNIIFNQGADYVYADLNTALVGDFNINGSLKINNSDFFVTDSSNSYTLNNNVILGGKYNSITFGTGNAIINSNDSAVNGKYNLDLNSTGSSFDPTSNFCTVLAGRGNFIQGDVIGSAVISDFTSTNVIANESNKFYISFQNGTDFVGNVGINDNLILNNGSSLLSHPNASAIFSGAVVADDKFILRAGSSSNGSSSYPDGPTSAGDKGQFAYFNNNFFIKNDGRWIKFFGSTGDWNSFNLSSGSLKLKTINQFSGPTTGDLISWSDGILNQSVLGVKEITSFPSFGGTGSFVILYDGESPKTVSWKDGIITSTGSFDCLGANGKSGSFNISTTAGTKSIIWKNGQILSTGDSSFSIGSDVLVYMTGDQIITGKKTFNVKPEVNGVPVLLQGEVNIGELPTTVVYSSGNQLISGEKSFATGVILQANNNQLQFKTGSAGFTGSITMPTIGANRTYTIPDVGFSADFVMNSGNQSIGGLKTFTTRPTVNGAGVLIQGDSLGVPTESIAYITGDQIISGKKTFHTGVVLQSLNNQLRFRTGSAGFAITISAPSMNTAGLTYTIPDVGFSAAFVMNSGDQHIGGLKTFTTRPEVNGTGVMLLGEAASSTLPTTLAYLDGTNSNLPFTVVKTFNNGLTSSAGITGTNLVYNTGNQTISGQKTFNDTLSAANINITSTGAIASLEIGGTGSIYIDLKQPNTDDYDFRIATDGTGAAFTTNSGSLDFNISGINRIHFNKNGNIGIGTTNPAYKLHVSGDSYISGQLYALQRPIVNATGVLLSGDNFIVYNTGNQTITGQKTIVDPLILQRTGDQLQFKTGSAGFIGSITMPTIGANRTYTIPDVGASADFVLTTGSQQIGGTKTFTENVIANGNIGIGTTNPTAKLTVLGNSYISGVITGNTLQATSSVTSHTSGAYLEWNKWGSDGQTYLLNQKGSNAGGIVIGDVSTANTITTGIFLNSSNTAQFYNRPFVNGTGVLLSGDANFVDTSNLVQNLSGSVSGIQSLTQTTYNSITKLNNVLYIITGV